MTGPRIQVQKLSEKLQEAEAEIERGKTEVECCLCHKKKVRHSGGALCAEGHLTCRECLEEYVRRCADDRAARRREGRVMCPRRARGCNAEAWSDSELEHAVSAPVFADYLRERKLLLETESRPMLALIVVVSAPDLRNAVIDAELLRATLEDEGWTVTMAPDLPKEQVEQTITNFVKAVRKKSRKPWLESAKGDCLFAFVGHGIQVKGCNYFYAADTELDLKYPNDTKYELAAKEKCLSFEWVQQQFASAQGTWQGGTVFVLDCCRVGLSKGVVEKQLTPQLTNAAVMQSTTSGEVAWDGVPGEGGSFMKSLCQDITSSVVEGFGWSEVSQRTRTKLVEGGQLAWNTGSLYKEFYFFAKVSLTPVSHPRLH